MHNSLKPLFLALSISFLTACGGGGGGDDTSGTGGETGGTGGDNGGSTSNIQPLTPLTSSGSSTLLGNTFSGSAGSNGDINAVIETGDGFPELKLSLNNPSMNVVNVQRTVAINGECENGDGGTGVLKTNYLTGVETLTGSDGSTSLSCTNTYATVLPTTIAGEQSIIALLIEYGEGDPISTTCPSDISDEDIVELPDDVSCTTEILSNYEVTDDNGTKHLISTKQIISF